MPKLAELADVAQAIEPASERALVPLVAGDPFRILVLGDFSARNHHAVFEPGQLGWRMPVTLDLDTVDSALSNFAPRLSLPMGTKPRRNLEVKFCGLDDFLPERLRARVEERGPAAPAKAQDCVRRVMHHPDFHALEAAWRSVAFLAGRAGSGPEMEICLLDVSKHELTDDVCAAADLSDCGFYRLLVRQSGIRAAHPWALCIGDYTFSSSLEDIETLNRLARVARHAGTPFLAAANPDWMAEELPEWQMLRESPQAAYLGLALPRFLVRAPHEGETEPASEDYLWGNPAFLIGGVLAEHFRTASWRMDPHEGVEIEGLPEPAAERELQSDELDDFAERGFTPLGRKSGGSIALPRIQSVRRPATPLRGRWA